MYNIAEESEDGNEKHNETLLGIHSGGDNPFIAARLKKKTYPKWYIRVRTYHKQSVKVAKRRKKLFQIFERELSLLSRAPSRE